MNENGKQLMIRCRKKFNIVNKKHQPEKVCSDKILKISFRRAGSICEMSGGKQVSPRRLRKNILISSLREGKNVCQPRLKRWPNNSHFCLRATAAEFGLLCMDNLCAFTKQTSNSHDCNKLIFFSDFSTERSSQKFRREWYNVCLVRLQDVIMVHCRRRQASFAFTAESEWKIEVKLWLECWVSRVYRCFLTCPWNHIRLEIFMPHSEAFDGLWRLKLFKTDMQSRSPFCYFTHLESNDQYLSKIYKSKTFILLKINRKLSKISFQRISKNVFTRQSKTCPQKTHA